MPMNDYIEAKRLLDGRDDADFPGPFPTELVDRAAATLDVRIPDSYRRFLSDFGCLGILSEEIYGIVGEDLLRGPVPNGVWLTLDERVNGGLDHRYVILASVGFGGWYALDTARMNPYGECPVAILTPAGEFTEDVASDFGKFLLDRVTQAIEFANVE